MAKPQLENGYFKLANELRQAFAQVRIPGEAMQVLWVIFGKTYGFNKKSDHVSLSQFVDETKLSKTHVCIAIRKLVTMNIIVTEKGNNITKYAINKDFDEWKPLPKKVTLPKKVIIVTEKGNQGVPIKVHTKDTSTKDKRQLRESAKTPHPAMIFLTDFGRLFKTRFGTTYVANFKKDVQLVKGMLSAIEYDDLLNRAGQFLRDEDDFIKKAGYTVGTFRSKVNKYVTKKQVNTNTPFISPLPVMTKEEQERADKAKYEMLEKLKKQGVVRI